MASGKTLIGLFAVVCGLVALAMFVAPNKGRSLLGKLQVYDSGEVSWVEFQAFARKYNKTYSSFDEMYRRYTIFHDNFYQIQMQNQRNLNTRFAVNHFADLTNEEFRNTYLGYKEDINRPKNYVLEHVENLAETIDWQRQGAVTPVKDQGQCGSCWAFSAVASLEGAYFQKTGQLTTFSEQELVDCSGSFGNQGCNGGLMDNAFQYWKQYSEMTESDYPYTGKDGSCQQISTKGVTVIANYVDVPTNEAALKSAVNGRVVSVAVDASTWTYYSGGIYNGYCSSQLDHGVTLVGYGTENGQDYWRIKNSWNTWWGENGYIRLKRTDSSTEGGQCGVATAASYPVL